MPRSLSEEHCTVGFDLDMTLVDTRPGIHASLVATSEETGVAIDADGVIARLGPPIQTELAKVFAENEVDTAFADFSEAHGCCRRAGGRKAARR